MSPLRSVFVFSQIWLALFASFWCVGQLQALPWHYQVPLSVLVIVFIGTRQNAFAVQIHEASHGLLIASRKMNDAFCNFFGAYWVLNDVRSYWAIHKVHHSNLHEENDPDLDLYRLPPSSGRWRLYKVLAKDLLFMTSIRRIHDYLTVRPPSEDVPRQPAAWAHSLGKIGAQGILWEVTGRKIPISPDPETRPADVRVYVTDHRRVSDVRGWQPTRDVRAALEDIHRWIENADEEVRSILLGGLGNPRASTLP